MYTRAQFILALAIVACFLCLAIAFPAADNELNISNKVRNPRLGGSRISKQLGKRDEDQTFNIDLSGNDNNTASSATAVASTASASAAPIASTSAAVSAATNAPTPIPTAAPTATTHYASSFVFTASLKDTHPLNDGLSKMASLREKGLKKSKKASAKSASKASKSTGKVTSTTAATATATSN